MKPQKNKRADALRENAKRFPMLFADVESVFNRCPTIIKRLAVETMAGDLGEEEINVLRNLVAVFRFDTPLTRAMRVSSVMMVNLFRWPYHVIDAAHKINCLPPVIQEEVVRMLGRPLDRASAAHLNGLLCESQTKGGEQDGVIQY